MCRAYERLVQELELFKRRLFIAKAERIDTRQLELDYAGKLQELERISGTLGLGKADAPNASAPNTEPKAKDGKALGKRANNRGTGRRTSKSCPYQRSASNFRTLTWSSWWLKGRSFVTASRRRTSFDTNVVGCAEW